VTDKNGRVVGFVDLTGADFDTLTDYRNANVLPDDSHIITREDWSDPDSALTMTTAHHTSGVEWAMDYVVAPAAIIGGVIATPFAPPVGVTLIAAGTGYYVGKAVGNVIVRAQHGQSNGFDNPAAVADYVTLGTSAFFGVGSVVRPLATTAAGAAMRGAAATAAGGMTAYSAVDTALNWNTMTPGQQRNSIIGLAEGGVMTLSPLAARGLGAVFKPGTMPSRMSAGLDDQVGGALTQPGLASITLRGRLATLTLGAQVRSVLDQVGSANGRGGRIMTSAEVIAALRARGIKVLDEAALRDAINSTPGIDYVGDPSIGGIVRTGAGEFVGMRMSLEDSASQPTRQQVFDELVKENRAIREAEYSEGANRKIKNKWPERTVTTGRASGTVNGRPFDQKIAAASGEERLLKGTGGEHLPALPADGHLIFKTREFDGTPRKYDSEPKAFEKLARDILEVGSGKSRQAVEDAIVGAIEQAPKTPDGYPANATDVIDAAASRLGVNLDHIKMTVEMVIDFPRGRREMSPQDQVCGSCQSLMDDFERAFRDNVTIRARNLDGETLW
jgi:hypothetical protein